MTTTDTITLDVQTAREWQPIETAPKDGSNVLLGRFTDGKAEIDHNGHIAVDYWHKCDRHGFEGWGKFNARLWPATHWMPLPPRPALSKLREKLK